jgi:hypothetical protein
MREARAIRIGLALMVVSALGCGGGSSSPTEPAQRDSLTLVSVQPAQGAQLRIGDTVEVLARMRYSFVNPGGGQIGVIAYPLPFGLPIFTDPFQFNLEGQQGEATLLLDMYLADPDEPLRPGMIQASFALFPQGQRESTASVDIRYEVVP